jgi:hypothetical protein
MEQEYYFVLFGNGKDVTSLSTRHFGRRCVLGWLRHFTPKLRCGQSAGDKGVITERSRVPKSSIGKWMHPAYTGASFAYFLTVIDKAELIASRNSLVIATSLYAVALLLNALFSFAYYLASSELDLERKINKYWVLRRFSGLSQWSFILATVALVYSVVASLWAS